MQDTQAALLIVDNEPSVRLTLLNVLAEVGYSVRSAENGLCALREIRNEVPKRRTHLINIFSSDFCETGSAQGVSADYDGRPLELSDEQWELVEPILRPGSLDASFQRTTLCPAFAL